MNFLQQPTLLVALPLLYAYLGTTVAAILAQKNLPDLFNGLIAWSAVLICAGISAYVAGGITAGMPYAAIINAVIAAATVLISGGLASLKPYLFYMDFLKMNVFNIVKPSPIPTLAPAIVSKVTKATMPTPIALPSKPIAPPTTQDHSG